MSIRLCPGSVTSKKHRFSSGATFGVCGVCGKKVRFTREDLIGKGYAPERHYIKTLAANGRRVRRGRTPASGPGRGGRRY